MSTGYLIDENLNPFYKAQLLLKKPDFTVYALGDPGCPSKGTPDPEILCWCEEKESLVYSSAYLCNNCRAITSF